MGARSDNDLTATWSAADAPETDAPELPARWRTVRALGRGGQAEVWLVEDLEVGELVAFKLLPPGTAPAVRERLRREVRVGRSLQHPSLVRLFDLHEVGDRLGVAMEYLPGGSLAGRIAGGALPVDAAVAVARQALDALAFLHRNGIVHRDVKPANLLLDGDGSVKLADLGLVRALDETSDLTAADVALGTPAYMSPEQRVGGAAGLPADLYGLGLTLREALTGTRPGRQGGCDDGNAAPRADGLPRDCPRWLRRFVARLLEVHPRDRWPDAGAALQAFEARRGLGSPRLRRRAVAAALATAACVAALAVAMSVGRPDLDGATVQVSGETVTLRDRAGRRVWEKVLSGQGRAALVADLVGDRRAEVAVAVDGPAGAPAGSASLEVYSDAGRLEARAVLDGPSVLGQWPGMNSAIGEMTLYALALERGAAPTLGWVAFHPTWYPNAFGLWDLRNGLNPYTLLRNSGHLHQVVAADLDGDSRAELVLTGVNNPLGYQSVLAIIRVPRTRADGSTPGFDSPDDLLTLREEGLAGLAPAERPVYTLLGTNAGAMVVRAAGAQGITVGVGDRTVELDACGNPRGGPLDGAGALPRQRYWTDLRRLCQGIEEGSGGGSELAGFENDNAVVLDEAPHRVAAELMVARSLARAGQHREAAGRLEAAVARSPEVNDLRLRLGEQLVISGEVARGVAVLLDASSDRAPGRMSLDALFDLAHVAVLNHDEALQTVVETRLRAYFPSGDDPNAGVAAALAAFVRGRFEDPSLDQGARPHLLPEVAVFRCWAKLERGAPPAEIASEAGTMAGDAEVAPLARLLQAYVLTRNEQGARARGVAEAALAELTQRARTEVDAFTWLGLGERVLADACRSAGDPLCADAHRRRAAELAPRTWFGGGTPPG